MCHVFEQRRETATDRWSCFIRRWVSERSEQSVWFSSMLSPRPNSALLIMMKDQFANYVIQKVRFCQGDHLYRIMRFRSAWEKSHFLNYFLSAHGWSSEQETHPHACIPSARVLFQLIESRRNEAEKQSLVKACQQCTSFPSRVYLLWCHSRVWSRRLYWKQRGNDRRIQLDSCEKYSTAQWYRLLRVLLPQLGKYCGSNCFLRGHSRRVAPMFQVEFTHLIFESIKSRSQIDTLVFAEWRLCLDGKSISFLWFH